MASDFTRSNRLFKVIDDLSTRPVAPRTRLPAPARCPSCYLQNSKITNTFPNALFGLVPYEVTARRHKCKACDAIFWSYTDEVEHAVTTDLRSLPNVRAELERDQQKQ